MDWDEYKASCERPDYFSRWALALTREILESARICGEIDRILDTSPLPKPDDHKGGVESDFFHVDVPAADARHIVEAIERAGDERRLKHLGVVWREYQDLMEGNHGT